MTGQRSFKPPEMLDTLPLVVWANFFPACSRSLQCYFFFFFSFQVSLSEVSPFLDCEEYGCKECGGLYQAWTFSNNSSWRCWAEEAEGLSWEQHGFISLNIGVWRLLVSFWVMLLNSRALSHVVSSGSWPKAWVLFKRIEWGRTLLEPR